MKTLLSQDCRCDCCYRLLGQGTGFIICSICLGRNPTPPADPGFAKPVNFPARFLAYALRPHMLFHATSLVKAALTHKELQANVRSTPELKLEIDLSKLEIKL